MARAPKYPSPRKVLATPANLRPQLEAARLDLRALFRALDQMIVAQELPGELRRLLELDADFAEALWVLDQPRGKFDLVAMARDTMESLKKLSSLREAFLASLDDTTRAQLEIWVQATRGSLSPGEAYRDIPGRDPTAIAARMSADGRRCRSR